MCAGAEPRIGSEDGLAFADGLLRVALLQVFGSSPKLRRCPLTSRGGGLSPQGDNLGQGKREE